VVFFFANLAAYGFWCALPGRRAHAQRADSQRARRAWGGGGGWHARVCVCVRWQCTHTHTASLG
jgi:hypothetical protein